MSSNLTLFDEPIEPRRPRNEVRIKEVRVEPTADAQRVAVWVELTPFIERPNIDITLWRGEEEVRSLSVVATMQHQMQVTLHLPRHDPVGAYEVQVDLVYEDEIQQSKKASFEVAAVS